MGTWVFRFSNFQAGGARGETSPLTSLFIHWMGALLPMGHPIKLPFPPGAGLIPCAPHGNFQGCDMGACNRGTHKPSSRGHGWRWTNPPCISLLVFLFYFLLSFIFSFQILLLHQPD